MLSHLNSLISKIVPCHSAGPSVVARPKDFRGIPDEALERTVWDRFSDIAKTFPKNIALEEGGSTWTYQQLQRKAEHAAAAMWKTNPDNTAQVALLLKNGAWLIVGILAAVRLEQPYVMLDVRLPHERLRRILAQSRAGMGLFHANRATLAVKIFPPDFPRVELRAALEGGSEAAPQPDLNAAAPFCILHHIYVWHDHHSAGSGAFAPGGAHRHSQLLGFRQRSPR